MRARGAAPEPARSAAGGVGGRTADGGVEPGARAETGCVERPRAAAEIVRGAAGGTSGARQPCTAQVGAKRWGKRRAAAMAGVGDGSPRARRRRRSSSRSPRLRSPRAGSRSPRAGTPDLWFDSKSAPLGELANQVSDLLPDDGGDYANARPPLTFDASALPADLEFDAEEQAAMDLNRPPPAEIAALRADEVAQPDEQLSAADQAAADAFLARSPRAASPRARPIAAQQAAADAAQALEPSLAARLAASPPRARPASDSRSRTARRADSFARQQGLAADAEFVADPELLAQAAADAVGPVPLSPPAVRLRPATGARPEVPELPPLPGEELVPAAYAQAGYPALRGAVPQVPYAPAAFALLPPGHAQPRHAGPPLAPRPQPRRRPPPPPPRRPPGLPPPAPVAAAPAPAGPARASAAFAAQMDRAHRAAEQAKAERRRLERERYAAARPLSPRARRSPPRGAPAAHGPPRTPGGRPLADVLREARTANDHDLIVKKSTHPKVARLGPQRNRGLFARTVAEYEAKVRELGQGGGAPPYTGLPKGAYISEYQGERLTPAQVEARYPGKTLAPYVHAVEHGSTLFYIDADPARGRTGTALAHLANDAYPATQTRRVNAEFVEVGDHLLLRTTEAIKPGQEIFVNYGKEYFNRATPVRTSHAPPVSPAAAAADAGPPPRRSRSRSRSPPRRSRSRSPPRARSRSPERVPRPGSAAHAAARPEAKAEGKAERKAEAQAARAAPPARRSEGPVDRDRALAAQKASAMAAQRQWEWLGPYLVAHAPTKPKALTAAAIVRAHIDARRNGLALPPLTDKAMGSLLRPRPDTTDYRYQGDVTIAFRANVARFRPPGANARSPWKYYWDGPRDAVFTVSSPPAGPARAV